MLHPFSGLDASTLKNPGYASDNINTRTSYEQIKTVEHIAVLIYEREPVSWEEIFPSRFRWEPLKKTIARVLSKFWLQKFIQFRSWMNVMKEPLHRTMETMEQISFRVLGSCDPSSHKTLKLLIINVSI